MIAYSHLRKKSLSEFVTYWLITDWRWLEIPSRSLLREEGLPLLIPISRSEKDHLKKRAMVLRIGQTPDRRHFVTQNPNSAQNPKKTNGTISPRMSSSSPIKSTSAAPSSAGNGGITTSIRRKLGRRGVWLRIVSWSAVRRNRGRSGRSLRRVWRVGGLSIWWRIDTSRSSRSSKRYLRVGNWLVKKTYLTRFIFICCKFRMLLIPRLLRTKIMFWIALRRLTWGAKLSHSLKL